jgi:D-beta-D-heptose 7-phosphate kinase / D-beta-D-heptose 1-phosphate adenosyltransferase
MTPYGRIVPSIEEMATVVAAWRDAGKKIVMTSGVFDIVHLGHVHALGQARNFGDCLLVAINTDASVQRKKGPKRPINNLQDRMKMLAALRVVDAVGSFDEPDDQPFDLVKRLRPDVFVKSSGEWSEASYPFRRLVEEYGGRAELVSHTAGYSTTSLIGKIIDRYKPKDKS